MSKPIIMTVDDEPEVLNAIERDLRKEYGSDYRVMKAQSGAEALETLKALRKRNDIVAILLSDQRMPGMTGTEFLAQASDIFPEARKVLLTAYADTEAAIDAINEVGLNNYILKPWDPPIDKLYPLLNSLLDDWNASVRRPYEGIRVAGAQWSASSHEVKSFLTYNLVPYQYLDVDKDSRARELVEEVNDGELRLPTVFFPDGGILVEPDRRTLAEKAGLQTEAKHHFYDTVIVGSGPAGLAAAVYGATEGLGVLLIEKDNPGGQAAFSAKIDNYLGFPSGISGAELTQRAITQAKRFGVEILTPREVTGIRLKESFRFVQLDDGSEIACHTVIIATGAGYRQLGIEGIENYTGKGVYYGAATTEAHNYRDQPVFVVGGANSAGQGAMYLTRFASKVYMLVRRNSLKAAHYLQKALTSHPKIEILYESDLVGFEGDDLLERVIVRDIPSGEDRVIDSPALFIFIGVKPRTDFVTDVVQCADNGYILTGTDLVKDGKPPADWPLERMPFVMETSVPGIFAAGDVRLGTKYRVAASVGDGGIAISMVHEYLKTV